MKKKTEDRKIDVYKTAALGKCTREELYISRGTRTTVTATRLLEGRRRELRIPTGGRALPIREKPFTYGLMLWTTGRGTLSWEGGGLRHTWSGCLGEGVAVGAYGTVRFDLWVEDRYPFADASFPPAINTDLLSQTEVKALNKLRDKSYHDRLNVGMMWAERRETISLFKDGAVGLVKLATALKRGDISRALDVLISDFRLNHLGSGFEGTKGRQRLKRQMKQGLKSSGSLLDKMSSVVLMYNLGLSPLMKDLETASMLLRTGLLTKAWDIKAVSRYGRQLNDVVKTDHGPDITSYTTVNDYHGYTVTLIGQPNYTDSAKLAALGISNPVSLIYQATTATFIVDYFLALGPWLEAISIPKHFIFKEGSWTHRVRRLLNTSVESLGGNKATASLVLNYTQRKLYVDFPLPLPPLSLRERELSEKQLLNTGLVAIQKLKQLLF